MQSWNWDDLRYVLALYRTGTLVQAARRLGVSDTTVARRIHAFEEALGVSIVRRDPQGKYTLTDVGQRVLERAERVEGQSTELSEELGDHRQRVEGTVSVSAVPILTHRVLLAALPKLHEAHPLLTVELIPDSRNLDLSRREADLAVRFSRPASGGLKTRAQKLASLEFAAFVQKEAAAKTLPWILYGDTHTSLPQAKWLAQATKREGQEASSVRVVDAETALEATALGLGMTLLPTKIGEADQRLRRVSVAAFPPMPRRDVWMLSHTDQAERRAIKAVKHWLTQIDW